MSRFVLLIVLSFGLLLAGCKTDAGKPVPVGPADPETISRPDEPQAVQPESAPVKEESAHNFGQVIEGATKITLSTVRVGDKVVGSDKPLALEGEWVTRFVAAIGGETVGTDAVPKCLPKYTMVFANAEGELGAFNGVCAEDGPFILVKDGKAYTAANPADAHALIKEARP